MADNATTARSFYDAWNKRNFAQAAEMMAPDGELVVVGTGEVHRGPQGVVDYDKGWADGFPDGRVTIDRVVASGNQVVVEITGRGTHTGTLASKMGSIAATGRSVTLKLCDVYEFGDDGKIRSMHNYFDSGSLMAQLGVTAGQAAATQ